MWSPLLDSGRFYASWQHAFSVLNSQDHRTCTCAIHHRLHNDDVMIWQHYTVDRANSSLIPRLVRGHKSLGTKLGLTPARSENTGERSGTSLHKTIRDINLVFKGLN